MTELSLPSGVMGRRRFVTALMLAGVLGCSKASKERVLIVGMELVYPPFEMKDPFGNPAGLSVDLARELAKALDRELRIDDIAFDGLIPALKTGKIDLIISSLTRTEERAKSIDFSEPYLATGLSLLVAKDSPVTSITNLDTAGRKVAVKKGTTSHLYATSHITHAEVLVLDKEAAAVLEVVQGKVDAFIYDQMSILQHWQRNPDTTRPLLVPFQREEWAIGIRKGNTILREQVNEFLRAFRDEGGFERLGDLWLTDQKEVFRKHGLPFYF